VWRKQIALSQEVFNDSHIRESGFATAFCPSTSALLISFLALLPAPQ
jgi:hypothetical protein